MSKVLVVTDDKVSVEQIRQAVKALAERNIMPANGQLLVVTDKNGTRITNT